MKILNRNRGIGRGWKRERRMFKVWFQQNHHIYFLPFPTSYASSFNLISSLAVSRNSATNTTPISLRRAAKPISELFNQDDNEFLVLLGP